MKRLILERLQEEDGPRGDFEKIWEVPNVTPKTVTPGFPLAPFTYHAEWGGVDTFGFPGYLRPARYRVKATVRVSGRDRTKFINFEVTECTFNDSLFLRFP